jgi:hypothetical protein
MSSGVIAVSELNSGLATKSNYEAFALGAPPAAAVAQTLNRLATGNVTPLVSGREHVTIIWLDAGTVVRSATYFSNTQAAVAPTNQWFALRDPNRVLRAITNDDTTTAWAANVKKTLTFTTPYTVTVSGFHYVTIMVVAGTVPSLSGANSAVVINLEPPLGNGSDNTNTGLTTPATAPAVSALYTPQQAVPYAYLS